MFLQCHQRPRRLLRHLTQQNKVCTRCASTLVLVFCVLLGGVTATSAVDHDVPAIISRISRHPVESKALASVGYSRRLRALEIEFKRGGTYRYLEVPRSVYLDLIAAESKAGFYNKSVRGKYRSVYVRPARKR